MNRGRLSLGLTCAMLVLLVSRTGAAADLITPTSRSAIVLRLDPRSAASIDRTDSDRLALADRLQYQHRFAEAEAVLAAHLANKPGDANAMLRRAQVRLEAGRPRDALADCVRASPLVSALAASACQAQALARLGQAQRARESIDQALLRANESAREAPAVRSWAAGVAADLAAAVGDDAVAEARYREAVALAGDTHYPRIAYAQFLVNRQRPDDALALLAAAPDDASVMRLRRIALEMSR